MSIVGVVLSFDNRATIINRGSSTEENSLTSVISAVDNYVAFPRHATLKVKQ